MSKIDIETNLSFSLPRTISKYENFLEKKQRNISFSNDFRSSSSFSTTTKLLILSIIKNMVCNTWYIEINKSL